MPAVVKPPPWKYRMPGRSTSPFPSGVKILRGISASGPGAAASTTEATSSVGSMKPAKVWMIARPSSSENVSNGGSPIDSKPVMIACACGCSGMSSPPCERLSAGERSWNTRPT